MSGVKQWLIELTERAHAGDYGAREILIENGQLEVVSPPYRAALCFAQELGWAIIPQKPGSKRPCIKWKQFKDQLQRPTTEQLTQWFSRWPDAGLIGLLGPVSGLFAIDVDGEAAHKELVKRLGSIPVAPRSWRGKKFRYHLFFRHPDGLPTQARYTPWHPELEFRGHGGYVVLAPSRHESGQHYRWVPGRSPYETELPEVPEQVLAALKEKAAQRQSRLHQPAIDSRAQGTGNEIRVNLIPGLVRATMLFLRGHFANASNWNNRLFSAACDMAGNGIDEATATKKLIAGAGPQTATDAEKALATIRSAFSVKREPASNYFPKNGNPQNSSRMTISLEPRK